jgi:hypothetical protein
LDNEAEKKIKETAADPHLFPAFSPLVACGPWEENVQRKQSSLIHS